MLFKLHPASQKECGYYQCYSTAKLIKLLREEVSQWYDIIIFIIGSEGEYSQFLRYLIESLIPRVSR